MNQFTSIIKHDGALATYQVQSNYDNTYTAFLLRQVTREGMALPEKITIKKESLGEPELFEGDPFLSKLAAVILEAERNHEGIV